MIIRDERGQATTLLLYRDLTTTILIYNNLLYFTRIRHTYTRYYYYYYLYRYRIVPQERSSVHDNHYIILLRSTVVILPVKY